jgi:hypothetical protein
MVLIAVIFLIMSWFVRSFPLKAQDRAIKAEENLRYYVMTGLLLFLFRLKSPIFEKFLVELKNT